MIVVSHDTIMGNREPVTKYTPHHFDHAEGHIFLRKKGACTVTLTGAASMPQSELDDIGAVCAEALKQHVTADSYTYVYIVWGLNPRGPDIVAIASNEKRRDDYVRSAKDIGRWEMVVWEMVAVDHLFGFEMLKRLARLSVQQNKVT